MTFDCIVADIAVATQEPYHTERQLLHGLLEMFHIGLLDEVLALTANVGIEGMGITNILVIGD